MNKKRTCFLFGAGAAIAWRGPSTPELTTLVRSSGFKIKNEELTITEFIFRRLRDHGFDELAINFETIISVIEEFIVYYSRFDGEKNVASILSSFFKPNYENDLLNFSIAGGVETHGYKLQVPSGVEYSFAKHAYYRQTPSQFFFQHLLELLLTEIQARISKYAYHSNGNNKVIKTESKVSLNFRKWFRNMSEERVLRIYSLNYDRLFKILLEREGLQVFEGFDCGEYIDPGVRLRANVPKIVNDTESIVHYNLHGSAFWEVIEEDQAQLPNPEIFLTGAPTLAVNYTPASFQVEKGRTIVVTNIVTGYQKAQKGMITPFKQMQSAFDKDCCCSDKLYIIGYSFADEHINESIKTAIRHNPKLKIVIVDPSFMKNNMDYQFALRFFPFRLQGELKPKKVSEDLYSFFDEGFIVHTISFSDFLERMATAQFGRISEF